MAKGNKDNGAVASEMEVALSTIQSMTKMAEELELGDKALHFLLSTDAGRQLLFRGMGTIQLELNTFIGSSDSKFSLVDGMGVGCSILTELLRMAKEKGIHAKDLAILGETSNPKTSDFSVMLDAMAIRHNMCIEIGHCDMEVDYATNWQDLLKFGGFSEVTSSLMDPSSLAAVKSEKTTGVENVRVVFLRYPAEGRKISTSKIRDEMNARGLRFLNCEEFMILSANLSPEILGVVDDPCFVKIEEPLSFGEEPGYLHSIEYTGPSRAIVAITSERPYFSEGSRLLSDYCIFPAVVDN